MGALYRIPLTRVLGAHGMGMYQSVYPLYALLVTLCGGGLTAAVSKLVAEGEENALQTAFKTAFWFSVPLSFFVAALARFFAAAAGAPSAAAALVVLLPAVPISALCAALRGYFQGSGNMIPSAVGQCLEQAVKFAAGLTLSALLSRVSPSAAVAGCAAGVTVSEAASLAFYAFRRKWNAAHVDAPALAAGADNEAVAATQAAFTGIEALSETSDELVPPAVAALAETGKGEARSAWVRLVQVALPVTLGLLVLPLCQVADSFIVVNLLVRAGTARESATALYGLVTGPINAMVNMPAVLTVGVCGSLLPRVSQLLRRGEDVRKTVRRVLLFSAAAGVVFCGGIIVLAPTALRILYGKSLGVPLSVVSALLRTASVSVLCISVMQTASAVLQGGGKAFLPAVHLLLAAVVKETLLFVLLPRIGIYGFVVATDAFYALACLLDGVALALFLSKRSRK